MSGSRERAVAGTELGVRVEPTSTIALETTLARREDADGSGRMTSGARVGLSWGPHPWVSFRAGWDDVGLKEESASFGVRISVPLGGGRSESARWSGLGRVGAGSGSGRVGHLAPGRACGAASVRRARGAGRSAGVSGEHLAQQRRRLRPGGPSRVQCKIRREDGQVHGTGRTRIC